MSSLAQPVTVAGPTIIRTVRVNRARTPQEALAATERRQDVNDAAVAEMPRGDSDEAEVIFFKVGRWISDDDLEKEYELRGLVPADPYALAAVNEQDPVFSVDYPNGTHWKNANDRWCYAAFDRWLNDDCGVHVHGSRNEWSTGWWFAGLRKNHSAMVRITSFDSDLFEWGDALCLRVMVGNVTPEEKATALELIDRLQNTLTEMKKVVESI
ncbi:hypothetical protein [Methylocystis hirsuta]|uniref:Uncharacterized protein n=1 Tax=Methylocystis hirsuta TaxID=369798 RepID=A0A3M9XWS5_9HYPH|nr:hypothetical protein [Methylocystis hirsuta]RNJ51370.1 hypothetical protein D1O30_18995 [Methylocystis hirsuta]